MNEDTRRLIGFEMQPLVEALGIQGGVTRLVLEIDVGKPVMVYYTKYLEAKRLDPIIQAITTLKSYQDCKKAILQNMLQVSEVDAVEVDEKGNVSVQAKS